MSRPNATVVAVLLALLCLAPGFFATSVAGQEATPCPSTSLEENEALVRRLYEEAWGHGDLAVLNEILADDFILHIPSLLRATEPGADASTPGPAAMGETIERFRSGFPDLQVTVEDLVAEGDTVAARTIWTGAQQASLGAFGAPAAGRRMEQETWGFARVACGKIAEVRALPDNLTMLRQLGIITDDELTDVGTPSLASPFS